MARDPKDLLARFLKKQIEQADRIEAKVDAEMDEHFTGGCINVTIDEHIDEKVFQELVRRYPRWKVSKRTGTQYNETYTNLSFAPKPEQAPGILEFT